MKIPSANPRAILTQMLANMAEDTASMPYDLKCTGTPVFLQEDLNQPDLNFLDRTLRNVCIDDRITLEYVDYMFSKYKIDILGLQPGKSAGSTKSNLLKAVRAGGISYKVFKKYLMDILGYEFWSFSMRKEDKIIVTKRS